jgi:hypothetical protein
MGRDLVTFEAEEVFAMKITLVAPASGGFGDLNCIPDQETFELKRLPNRAIYLQ